jgi:replicative DNA helicase
MSAAAQQVTGPGGQAIGIITGEAPPHSIEAEGQLIAGVLADATGSAWAIATNCGVRPKAFYRPAAQLVWKVLTELQQAGTPGLDLSVLAEELKLRGQLEKMGGAAGLVELVPTIGSSGFVRYYAELVVLLWEMRHTITLAGQLRENSLEFTNRETFAEKASEVGQKLIGLGRRSAQKTMSEKIAEAKEDVLSVAEGRADLSKLVPSGLPSFDALCKPFGAGGSDDRFIVIAGGSGHGKSVALRNIARGALHEHKRVLAYVRETGVHGFCKMMASAEVGFDLDCDNPPRDHCEAFEREMDRMIEEWANKLLFCVENEPATPLGTVEDLCEHARSWCHLHGTPAVLLVDYLQIFDTRRKGLTGEARVAYVSHQFQALQRELGCVMVIAAQLNESGLSEMRQPKRDDSGKIIHRMPHRGDLRESQAIYHDADRVIFLYMPPEDSAGNDQTQPGLTRIELWWYQEKRRAGRTRAVKAIFEKCYVRFVPHGSRHEAATAEPAAPAIPDNSKVSKSKYT